jgi:hypothetical protein
MITIAHSPATEWETSTYPFSPGGYPLAIKVVKGAFADDPEFRRRFRRE